MPLRILIVEDDQDIRQGLIVRLRASGYELLWSGDAISTTQIVQKEKPDLIILDLGLPGGDGFLVMDRLNALSFRTPIIVLSARDPLPNKERALKAGAFAFLQKPVDNEILLKTIQDCMASEESVQSEESVKSEERAPLMESVKPEERVLSVSREAPRTRKKILLVEDDQDIRQGLIIRLRANQFDTAWVEEAISTIRIVQKEKPDLIILDLGLPGGDGFLVMDRLNALHFNIPIIVLSARDPLLNKERAIAAGALAFLQKPVDNELLIETINSALEGKRPQGQPTRSDDTALCSV
jgi:DNA-binding response OmpR family regulator